MHIICEIHPNISKNDQAVRQHLSQIFLSTENFLELFSALNSPDPSLPFF